MAIAIITVMDTASITDITAKLPELKKLKALEISRGMKNEEAVL